ncbi:hypothetical protein ES708_29081 [subsurface metagenome]
MKIWLDGWEIPEGAQVWLSQSVHVLMLRIETGDDNVGWGVHLMNMKTVIETDGLLTFNTLSPAPDADIVAMDMLYAGGLVSGLDYLSTFTLIGLEGGSFETGLAPWTTNATSSVETTSEESQSGSSSAKFPETASYIEIEFEGERHATLLNFFYKRTGTTPQEHCIIVRFINGQSVIDIFTPENTEGQWLEYNLTLPTDFAIDSIKIATHIVSDIHTRWSKQ